MGWFTVKGVGAVTGKLEAWSERIPEHCDPQFLSVEEPMEAPTEIIFEITEAPEGGFDARPLGHSIFTQGEDWADLKAMVGDAVRCHFGDIGVHLEMSRDEVRAELLGT